MRVECSHCGKDHELEDMEPSYARPDVIDALGEPERSRCIVARDFGQMVEADGERAYFVRVLLPIPVLGKAMPCCWGIWARVDRRTFEEVRELWEDPAQLERAAWSGVIANQLSGYPGSLGLGGTLRFADVKQIPHFILLPEVVHSLATDQRIGVSQEQVREWQLALLHPDRAPSRVLH